MQQPAIPMEYGYKSSAPANQPRVRASELEKLKDALKDVKSAKDRLKKKAKQIFGDK